MDVPVTERQFLEQLHELSHKIKFVKERSFHDALACQDVQEVLEKLRIKVNIEFEISLKSISSNRQSVKFGNLSYKKSINFVNQ
jgi:dTDP-D-glucose 4,6-dehydratase